MGSQYLVSNTGIHSTRKRGGVVVSMLILAFLMSFLGVFHNVTTSSTASAGWLPKILCSDKNELGPGMSPGNWSGGFDDYPLADKAPRNLTVQQAFGNNVHYISYEGEGGKDKDGVRDIGLERGKNFSGWSKSLSKLEAQRSISNCTMGNAGTRIANGLTSITGFNVGIIQFVSSKAFDSHLVCDPDATVKNNACLPLTEIIGGKGAGKGIIGALTESVYFPLIVFAVLLTGCWVAYTGIIKRRFREAFFGFLWLCGSFIMGVIVLMHPQGLSRAPMTVTNTIASCAVGAFTGTGCDGISKSQAVPQSEGTNSLCYASVNGASSDEKAAIAMNSLSCSIWKAFVLEPFSQGQFGRTYDELNISNPTIATAIKKAGIEDPNETFCVNLSTTVPITSQGSVLKLDGSGRKVCNLAMYQLFLSTSASSGDSKPPASLNDLDTRWYNLVLTTANDDGLWSFWAGNTGSGGHRLGMAAAALISSMMGGFIIVFLSVAAVMYFFIAILMMAFAPIFLLFGVYPPGRRILLGWAQEVVGNALKYLVSLLYLLVTISVYSAILGSSSNIAAILFMVMVVSLALFFYRKEFLNLLGKADMGGQKMFEEIKSQANKRRDKAGKIGLAMAGSAIGAGIATAPRINSREDLSLHNIVRNTGKSLKSTTGGALAGLNRELKKSSPGIIGQTTAHALRERDRLLADNRRDLLNTQKQKQDNAKELREKVTVAENVQRQSESDMKNEEKSYTKLTEGAYKVANEKALDLHDAESAALQEMKEKDLNPDFVQMKEILAQISALSLERQFLIARGLPEDKERIEELGNQIGDLNNESRALRESIDPDEYSALEAEYAMRIDNNLVSKNLDPDLYRTAHEELAEVTQVLGEQEGAYRKSIVLYNNASKDLHEKRADSIQANAEADFYTKVQKSVTPDTNLTQRKVNKIAKKATEVGTAAVIDAQLGTPTDTHKDFVVPNFEAMNPVVPLPPIIDSGDGQNRRALDPSDKQNDNDNPPNTPPPPNNDGKLNRCMVCNCGCPCNGVQKCGCTTCGCATLPQGGGGQPPNNPPSGGTGVLPNPTPPVVTESKLADNERRQYLEERFNELVEEGKANPPQKRAWMDDAVDNQPTLTQPVVPTPANPPNVPSESVPSTEQVLPSPVQDPVTPPKQPVVDQVPEGSGTQQVTNPVVVPPTTPPQGKPADNPVPEKKESPLPPPTSGNQGSAPSEKPAHHSDDNKVTETALPKLDDPQTVTHNRPSERVEVPEPSQPKADLPPQARHEQQPENPVPQVVTTEQKLSQPAQEVIQEQVVAPAQPQGERGVRSQTKAGERPSAKQQDTQSVATGLPDSKKPKNDRPTLDPLNPPIGHEAAGKSPKRAESPVDIINGEQPDVGTKPSHGAPEGDGSPRRAAPKGGLRNGLSGLFNR